MSWRLRALNRWLIWAEKPYLARETDFARARARLEGQAWFLGARAGTRSWEAPLRAGGREIAALRLAGPVAESRSGRMILWLHGGAYCMGSPRTHAAMVATLARRLGAGGVLPGYRLAPEDPFPAAPEDALLAYRGLLAEGCDPAGLVLGGDSAGGGLAFAALHMILEAGLPPPACVVAFCPWVDMRLTGASLSEMAGRDVLLPVARIAEVRDGYLAGADPCDPRASPVLGRFRGGPPVLIQASRAEILRDDARAMAARLSAEGVAVELDLWRDVPHVWQFYGGRLPEADAALDQAARFVAGHLGG